MFLLHMLIIASAERRDHRIREIQVSKSRRRDPLIVVYRGF